MNRRQLIGKLSALVAGTSLMQMGWPAVAAALAVSKTREQWKKLLPPQSYAVLFDEATERPFSSPLNNEKRVGTYICAACNQPLFNSTTKFDSGTGWPSFFDAIPNAVVTKRDFKVILPRTEYHCVRCEGHQGHRFDDGPKPTGMRYCNNGVALQFIPADQKLPELRT